LKGLRPFKTNPSPSPFKERGIKGERLVKTIISTVNHRVRMKIPKNKGMGT